MSNEIKDKARELAQTMVNQGASLVDDSWGIEDTDDAIIVIAMRLPKKSEKRLRANYKSIPDLIATLPSGNTCPTCGGSGKV